MWVEVVSLLAGLGEWEAFAVGQVPSLISSASFGNALAVARVLVPEARSSFWSTISFRAILESASARAGVLVPVLISGAWVNSWLDADARAVLLRPEFVFCAVLWSADASTVGLRPMGGGSAHEWAADASIHVVGPDLHVVAVSWNSEALAARAVPVVTGSALLWSADASAFFSAEDLLANNAGTIVKDAFASTSLGVEELATRNAILWRALALSVHLIPVVSVGTGVVLLSELALARREVPDETWLALGWSAFALAVVNVEVMWPAVSIMLAIQWRALARARILVPDSVNAVGLNSVFNKTGLWLWLALARAGFLIPNEICDTWEVNIICIA